MKDVADLALYERKRSTSVVSLHFINVIATSHNYRITGIQDSDTRGSKGFEDEKIWIYFILTL